MLFGRPGIIPAFFLRTKILAASLMISSALGGNLVAEEKNTLRLATRPILPPYIQKNAESGIEIDIIKAIFGKMGKQVEFAQMDRVEMFNSFETGAVDGKLTQNISIAGNGCLTSWYLVHQNVGFTILSKGIQLNSLSDLATLPTVSFHNAKNFLGEAFMNSISKNASYKEIAPQSSHIGLLYGGDFDVIVGDEWIIRNAQRQHFDKTGEYQTLRVHQIMSPTLYSARFHKQETCDAFDDALRQLRRSGIYDQIVDGYHRRIMLEAEAAAGN